MTPVADEQRIRELLTQLKTAGLLSGTTRSHEFIQVTFQHWPRY